MRKLLAGFVLLTPLACSAAGTLDVEANSVLRVPVKGDSLSLDRVHVAEGGALLIPAQVRTLKVQSLELDRNARLGVFPGAQPLHIEVQQGTIADGAVIAAQGAAGSFERPASRGRSLVLHLQDVSVENLLIDVRGGIGAPGYDGLDGGSAKAGGCLWGSATRGGDGQNGTDGQNGAQGGEVRLEVAESFDAERIKVRLEGGAGGAAGKAGQAGKRQDDKGCLLYSVDGGAGGRAGEPGKPGSEGAAGHLDVVRF